ncbi:restriction endonuclease [Pseudomonas aeruginosa]|uniref:restriction endonuclease n=1 Tax=Pseudomonas aeruginosa TaxID=287 RepID=UPI0021C99076|nr:restriction endonuclease [Pseudomonas aeruginosa]
MKFKPRNLRAIAEMIIGDADYFPYRSSSYITKFFEECDLEYRHDGSTRWQWTSERLSELLNEPQPTAYSLPERFMHVLRVLMHKSDAEPGDEGRSMALNLLNQPLKREGYEAYYDEDDLLHVRHVGTKIISTTGNPHRPFTPSEIERREKLSEYLKKCSEDELIEEVLLPLFRQLGYHRITAAGHKDKSLEYGKDLWMRYVLPTQHVIYFGIQAKIGKLDAAGMTKGSNANVSEIYQQALMMLGHEIFDSETSRRVLVDHAFIVSAGEITKQARNWLGERLDATKRSQIMFMDRDDILNLYTANGVPLPVGADPKKNSLSFLDEDIPF